MSSDSAIVIGGGIYGSWIALELRSLLAGRVVLLEREEGLLQRASYRNQARVHGGYHYPRSLLTGLRSRVNYPRFVSEFEHCIDEGFDAYYAIARRFSNTSARRFRNFCARIGAPLERAPRRVRDLFNLDLIEDVFQVRECAFDAIRLRDEMLQRLQDARVEVLLGSEACSVRGLDDGRLELTYRRCAELRTETADVVLNCTFSSLNRILRDSGFGGLSLKHELAELALVEVPEPLREVGITVMCGPFFSLLPFPPRGLHSLSHVRYTPHCSWCEDRSAAYTDPYERFRSLPKRTKFVDMLIASRQYLPAIGDCRYVDSLWEIKTVLPRSEVDDSRPILFRECPELPKLVSVVGGKLDNVYDVAEVTRKLLS